MILLILGLVLFLGAHSIRIVADDWRTARIATLGEGPWKGLYSLVSAAGLVLIVIGYGQARHDTTLLWIPPLWTRHVAGLLVLIASVLIAAAYVPGTHIRARVGHPMLLGVKTWAVAHLLANGSVAAIVLFGSFLVWAVVDHAASRRRDRRDGKTYPALGWSRDVIAVVIGAIAWVAFAFWLHGVLIGVKPFGV